MTLAQDGPDLRPDIAASWLRANLAGVDQENIHGRVTTADIDTRSALLVSAGPVLDELERGLVGSGYATVLGDRECRLVRRWFDDAETRRGFDSLNIVEGASLLESTVGTNGLGTVFETQRPVTIHGHEHFVEALRGFSCYGHPIRHPLTRRIEGVLDISAVLDKASPLLPALISRAVSDIEQRLLDGSRVSEKCLLTAFQEASITRKRAVLAIGEDIVMCNQAASDLLSPADIALLRVFAEDPPHAAEADLRVGLESGSSAAVRVSRVSGARRGVLLLVTPLTATARPASRAPSTEPPPRAAAPTLIAGPPGTGRTTRARQLGQPPMKLLSAATALLEGEHSWAKDFERAMRRTEGSVCLDGIDLLPDELLDLVIERVDTPTRPQLVLTSGPVAHLSGRAATLAGTATFRQELLPLAARRAEIPQLVASMLKSLSATDSVHLTPGALRALTAHHWPGNLRELQAVVAHCAAARSAGGITIQDLPEGYRAADHGQPMAALEQAERDVIVTALRAAGGNKVQAAKELGVSRTTLYAKLRQLHITTW